MRAFIFSLASGSLLALSAAPASAASFTTAQINSANAGLQAMRELNVITFGNLNTNNHVQGKAFVGGSLNGKAGDQNSSGTFGQGNGSAGATPSSRPTLAVVGNTNIPFVLQNNSNGGSGTVATLPSADIGGNIVNTQNLNPDGWAIRAGGSIAAIGNVNPGPQISYGTTYGGSNGGTRVVRDASLAAGGANDLATSLTTQRTGLVTDLGQLSTVLGSLTSNGTMSTLGSNLTLDFTGATGSYGAYTISAASLFSYGALDIKLASISSVTTPAVINVTGAGAYTSALNINLSDAIAQNVIFNFIDATSLTIGAQFSGSLLATKATITNSSNITGSVVANVFNQNAEVHLGTYQGSSSIVTALAGPVPEPSTWAMMILGFGLVGGALRLAARPRGQASAAAL